LLRVVCFVGAPLRVRILQGRPWSADSTHTPDRKQSRVNAPSGDERPVEASGAIKRPEGALTSGHRVGFTR